MPKLAIIDDNRDQRETLRISISLALENRESELDVIDIFPFDSHQEYYDWIVREEVCVLIFDERLHNGRDNARGPVQYDGHDIVGKIRSRFKDIPIYAVTSFSSDSELQAHFSEFDDIIDRAKFKGEKYADIFIRATNRYLEQNGRELAEFSKLARQIALGNTNIEDSKRLEALQQKLMLPYSPDLTDRQSWIREYGEQLDQLESLIAKLIKR